MTTETTHSSALVAFLAGRGPDVAGLYIDDVLQLSDADLESTHDYIQWLFPLLTPSSAVPGVPILTRSEINAIRDDAMAQENLRRAADRMGAFYESTKTWLASAIIPRPSRVRTVSLTSSLITPVALRMVGPIIPVGLARFVQPVIARSTMVRMAVRKMKLCSKN